MNELMRTRNKNQFIEGLSCLLNKQWSTAVSAIMSNNEA